MLGLLPHPTREPPVQIRRIEFSGYRSFPPRNPSRSAEPTTLEIAPLTVVVGRNSSGKSAVVRLAHLVLASLARSRPGPLELSPSDRRFPHRFLDILHAYRFGSPLDLGLDLEDGTRKARLDLTLIQKGLLSDQAHPDLLKRSWHPADSGEVHEDDPPGEDSRGLLPRVQSAERWRKSARRLWEASAWIGPLREAIEPDYRRPGPDDYGPVLDPAGSQCAAWLYRDATLEEQVSAWYQEHLGAGRLHVKRAETRYELALKPGHGPALNLAHAGEGHQQALAFVTHALWRARGGGESPFLDVVEQPELHLHDAVHPPLGDLLLNMVPDGRGAVLVETHSEGLLLRLRRRVAEGKIDPSHVALYFVDLDPDTGASELKRIHLDSQGEVSWWPRGVFSETFEEVKAIRRAQRRRNGD